MISFAGAVDSFKTRVQAYVHINDHAHASMRHVHTHARVPCHTQKYLPFKSYYPCKYDVTTSYTLAFQCDIDSTKTYEEANVGSDLLVRVRPVLRFDVSFSLVPAVAVVGDQYNSAYP